MRIGILSDSHGRLEVQASAVAALLARGAEAIVHCGDLGSAECLEQLGEAGVPVYAVLGNTDHHAEKLSRAAAIAGVNFSDRSIEVPLGGGRSGAAAHGNDGDLLNQLIASGRHAYIFHGHTHRMKDERVGGVRVINPGALHNSRHPGHPTAALLDSATDTLEIIDLRAKARG